MPGFGVKPDLQLNEVVQQMERKSAEVGLNTVRANRAVAVNSASQNVGP